MSRIVKLDVRQVKRISAAHIEPDGSLVILGGKNAAGKSSVLDAIMYALAGKRATCEEPLRRGAKKGETTVTLDDGVTVRRTFTEAGGGTLTITTADGMSPKSAQAWLDARIGALSFDPTDFLRAKPADQAATLRRLVGIDTTALDAERARVYEERATINRDGLRAKGAADSLPHHPDAPEAEVSVALLVAEQRRRAEAQNANKAEQRAAVDRSNQADAVEREAVNAAKEAEEHDKDATALREQAAKLIAQAEEHERRSPVKRREAAAIHAAAVETQEAADSAMNAAVAKFAALPDPAELDAQIASAEEVNAKVRENAARAKALASVDSLRWQSQAKTDRLAEIDAERARVLATAKFPIPGLSISPAGVVTFTGLPLSQASQAEQIRVSLGVAAALSPDLRIVMIRDGSLLDEDSMHAIAEAAAEHDCQVWIERVGDADEGAIVIEDGTVRGAVEVAA